MINVLPSLLASDLLNMASDIDRMLDVGVDGLHIDVMDAHFVPNLSFGPSLVAAVRAKYPGVWLDVHLMMDNPERYIPVFADAGADAITIHAEIPGDAAAALGRIRDAGCKAGLSVKPKTGCADIGQYLPLCDLVLVMTVEPGFGGQAFMPGMLGKIKQLRGAFGGAILVDGGINPDTARSVISAGADTLVMGTALLRADDPGKVVGACKSVQRME